MEFPQVSAWWQRASLDGAVRVLGAAAVVVTIEALAGYFLWLGMTVHLHVPDALGWTLQVGLAGGSVVGTRAFHRGRSGEWQFGLAASVAAVAFLLVDGGVAALLHYGELSINAGWLAVGVLVECLIVGYLTVHTLMAGQASASLAVATKPVSTAPAAQEWGPPASVPQSPVGSVGAARARRVTTSPVKPAVVSQVEHAPGWSEDKAPAREPGEDSTKWVRRRARRVGVTYTGSTSMKQLRGQVEAAEVARAGEAAAA